MKVNIEKLLDSSTMRKMAVSYTNNILTIRISEVTATEYTQPVLLCGQSYSYKRFKINLNKNALCKLRIALQCKMKTIRYKIKIYSCTLDLHYTQAHIIHKYNIPGSETK